MKRARKDTPGAEAIPRFHSAPPPGESIHESETRIGDLSLVVEEALRASDVEGKATSKMGSFELAAALQKVREGEEREDEGAASRARLRSAPADPPPTDLAAALPQASEAPAASTMSRTQGFLLLAAALLLLALGTAVVIALNHH